MPANIAIFMNITPEFASGIGRRDPAEVAASTTVSSLADVILVSGKMAGAEPDVATIAAIREAVDPGGSGAAQHRRQGRDHRRVPASSRTAASSAAR